MTQPLNNLSPVKISDLLSKNFFIRSYQRGYRWSESQVLNLLDDINNFSVQNRCAENKTLPWYCLQPLVVKEMDEKTKAECGLQADEQWYEVIDGQQRLTTIFLIIHYVNEIGVDKPKMAEPNIRYETRPDSATFLKDIKVKDIKVKDDNTVAIKSTYIDYDYISKAYETIHNWAEKKKKEGFDDNGFKSTFNEHTKVIWYEVHTEKSTDVFTRLNMGKIRLTNAELVKALLLSQESIAKSNNEEELRLKRLEIATEWDVIENQLNNNSFWAFITNKKQSNYPTKIELLLELSVPESVLKDEFGVFNHYYSEWKNSKDIKQLWEGIVADFEIIKEWYSDHILYHMVGYLVSQDSKSIVLKELLDATKTQTKHRFVTDVLTEKIKALLSGVEIDSLNYKDNTSDIHRVLTLFNIITVMKSDGEMLKYPFKLHKNQENWSLEHIHAQKSDGLNTVKEWRSWLGAHNEVLKDSTNSDWKKLSAEIEEVLSGEDKLITKDVYDSFFDKVKATMSQDKDTDEVHGIENMALLSKDDNSALNSCMFAVKRRKILEMDKQGAYIPICTRNVFLKYYNEDATDYVFWGPEDRETYLNAIKESLRDYLPQTTNKPTE